MLQAEKENNSMKSINFYKVGKVTIFLFIIIWMSACSVRSETQELVFSTVTATFTLTQQVEKLPNKTPVPTITLNSIPTQTEEPTITQTVMPTPRPFSFESLSPSQYILYYSEDLSKSPDVPYNLKIVSINGQFVKTIPGIDGFFYDDIRLSPDKKMIAYNDFYNQEIEILDLETNLTIHGPKTGYCTGLEWSPDSTKLLITCESVYVYSINEKSLDPILLHEPEKFLPYCASIWSPDGKWIVTHRCYDDTNNQDRDGELFLTDATCIKNSPTCQSNTRLLEKVRSQFYSSAWSPDSRFVAAFYSMGLIGVWDIQTGEMRKIVLPTWTGGVDVTRWDYIAWSPDGKWLAFSQPDESDIATYWNIYIISPEGGEPKLVLGKPEDKFVMGWLTIP